jgi:hypothetical protein
MPRLPFRAKEWLRAVGRRGSGLPSSVIATVVSGYATVADGGPRLCLRLMVEWPLRDPPEETSPLLPSTLWERHPPARDGAVVGWSTPDPLRCSIDHRASESLALPPLNVGPAWGASGDSRPSSFLALVAPLASLGASIRCTWALFLANLGSASRLQWGSTSSWRAASRSRSTSTPHRAVSDHSRIGVLLITYLD